MTASDADHASPAGLAAKARYDALNAALIGNWFHNGPAVDEASFGYRHGWLSHEGVSYCCAVWYPDNQPVMD